MALVDVELQREKGVRPRGLADAEFVLALRLLWREEAVAGRLDTVELGGGREMFERGLREAVGAGRPWA